MQLVVKLNDAIFNHDYLAGTGEQSGCSTTHLQPGVFKSSAHCEPPPDRNLQQVVDEADGCGDT